MTRDPVCFEEIEIHQAPGFQTGGFVVEDLSSGINVVHGPNAAGKTTLAKAIEWLCWPDTAADHASLVGQLTLDDNAWRVDINNGRSSYQLDGQEANGPSLPPSHQRDRYRLSLHDLLQRDNHNKSFAETIEQESAGGYDLSAASDELGYSESPSRANKSVVQDAENAIEELREARADVDDLRQDQNELSRLSAKLEAARQAQQRVELLEQAIDYAKARDELEQAKLKLKEFPEISEAVDGDETERVEKLDKQIDEWTTKRNNAKETKSDAQNRLEDANLPEDGVPTGRLDHLLELRDDLDSAETEKNDLERDLADAKRQRDSAREDIPLAVGNDDLAGLKPVTWQTVSKFAREAEKVKAERETRDAVQRLLENETVPEPDLPTLQRASGALEKWLATSSTTTSDGSKAFQIALVSSISLAVTGIALGLLVNPLLLSILVLAAGILWYGLQSRSQSSDGEDPRQPHREAFQQTDVAHPDSWSDAEVSARLIELYDVIAEHELAKKRTDWRNSLATDSDTLTKNEGDLEETRNELQEQLGAAPDASDVELAVITKRVLDWQKANDEVEGIEKSIETVDRQIETARQELQAKLDPYSDDDIGSSGEATEAIRDLEDRVQQHSTAQRDLDQATTTIAEAADKIDALQTERDTTFTDLDLETGAYDDLETLCEQVDEYDLATLDVQEAKVRAETKAEELETYPSFESKLKTQEVANLRLDLREAERTAADLGNLKDRMDDIEADIRRAKNNDQVETALTNRDRALDALTDQLEDDYAAMVGDVLVNLVQEKTMESSRPEVFQRAREILAMITRGRYRLDFNENDASFRAYDEIKQKGLMLDELSSGTRVQVLLAVRIAFVEQQEQGVKIPLLLDETLANTDDRRAKTIIDSAIELARDGRQIFYFTAQGDEVAKWTAALEDATRVDHHIVDLAAVRDIDDSVQIPDLGSINSFTPAPPQLDGHDHASYGEALDIAPFNPYRGVDTVHLWTVFDDLETLKQFLAQGIERWGQLHNLLKWGNGSHLTEDSEQLVAAQQNAAALTEFVDAWKVGRGQPVDREVLDASGAISSNFIDRVTELATSLNGDGRQIIEALHNGEVNRFRSGKAKELESYLEENGYIESKETLDNSQIKVRVIEQFISEGLSREAAIDRTDKLLSRIGASSSP